ncbi:MAG: hypothetical protein D6814_03815 [Calditrichaeota bacterium]|nr:MAG: hypothetical protein D6814_03815 [Calditrichota bacterium]
MEKQLREAEQLFKQGRGDLARQKMEMLLQEHPYHAGLLNDLGVLAHQSGDPALAEAYFLQAFDADPQNLDVLWNLWHQFVSLNKPTAALAVLIHLYRALPQPDTDAEFRCALQDFCKNIVRQVLKFPELEVWTDRGICRVSPACEALIREACFIHRHAHLGSLAATLSALHQFAHHQDIRSAIDLLLEARQPFPLQKSAQYLLVTLLILEQEYPLARQVFENLSPDAFWQELQDILSARFTPRS